MADNKQESYAAAQLGSLLREDPSEFVERFAGLIDDKQTLDLLLSLNRNLDEPVDETPLGKEIITNLTTKTIDEAVRAGNVSQMKAATGMTNRKGNSEGEFFWTVGEWLSYEGSVGLVFGSAGSGKTSKIIDSAIAWRGRTDGTIFSNFETQISDKRFKSDVEMYQLMGSVKGPTLALIDEVAEELDGQGERSTAATNFANSIRKIRKKRDKFGKYAMKGSSLIVSHTQVGTAKDIRRMADFGIECPSKMDKGRANLLKSAGGRDEWEKCDSYSGISETEFEYDEYDESEFKIKVGEEDEEGEETTVTYKPDHYEEIITAFELMNEGKEYKEIVNHPGVSVTDTSSISRWKDKYASADWTPELE